MKAPRQNTFRIIGGVHRGRRFSFPHDPAIRPSPDRVRETVFNWLQPVIQGARCLDLYAGSGALGLEALSRGADEVHFVDRSRTNAICIREHAAALREGARVRVRASDVMAFLGEAPPAPFDVVFADPPYAAGLLLPTLELLAEKGWLKPAARIYMECARVDAPPALPEGWTLLRDKRAGQVAYALAVAG